MGFSATFSPVATGLFCREMAKNGHFSQKSRKSGFLAIIPHFGVFWAFLGPPGPPALGVLHQPPARGWEGPPRPPEGPPGTPGTPGGVLDQVPGPGPGDRESRRAPPPPGEGSPGPWGPGARVPAGPARGVLHQPLAPGPRGTGRGSRGPGTREVRKGPPGGPWATTAQAGLQTPSPGNRGAPPCEDGGHPPVRGAPGRARGGKWPQAMAPGGRDRY